jgi:hypothetical protein
MPTLPFGVPIPGLPPLPPSPISPALPPSPPAPPAVWRRGFKPFPSGDRGPCWAPYPRSWVAQNRSTRCWAPQPVTPRHPRTRRGFGQCAGTYAHHDRPVDQTEHADRTDDQSGCRHLCRRRDRTSHGATQCAKSSGDKVHSRFLCFRADPSCQPRIPAERWSNRSYARETLRFCLFE